MRLLLTAISMFFCGLISGQFKGVIINEFSQGDAGNREYIELLVVGNKTCNDSVADIRGWIVDDQNGWYGNSNASNGHYRFRDIPQWAAVPFGSIILLYNSAAGQKNLSITAADDPTDANRDYAYILPINSSAFLEEHDNEPTNASGPAYVYPAASSGTGYAGTSNTWINHIALNNTGGDVLSVISPMKRDSAFFSIGYGYLIATGFRQPTVSIADVTGGTSSGLIDSNYVLSAKWAIAPIPFFETPGSANGGINSVWIQKMRLQPTPQATVTTICSNGPYLFYGQTITTSGPHRVLTNNSNGCVDTNDLYLVIKRTEVKDTSACDSLVYKGVTYRSNATVTEVIKSVVIDCDSIVRTLTIRINKSSSSLTRLCLTAGQAYNFNNQTITTSGNYAATLINLKGCDSIARLQIVFRTIKTDTIRGCTSVVFNGTTYAASTTLADTVKSIMIAGCDSIIKKTVIIINPIRTTLSTACTTEGSTYNFLGTTLTASGLYSTSLQTTTGCDSVVSLYILFSKTNVQTFTGCDSVVINGSKYVQSAVLKDTIRSVVSACDSIITIKNIVVNQTKRRYSTHCTSASSYNFNGQTLMVSGLYSQTLSTSAGCDSVVSLYIVFTKNNVQSFTDCDSVVVNGIRYIQSTTVRDTIRSVVTGCDSVINTINIKINESSKKISTTCTPAPSYNFGGQILTSSGLYSQHYTTLGGCDSLVQLYLVLTQVNLRTITGCTSVNYNGTNYLTSTVVRDTIKSTVAGCDSIINVVTIQVNHAADIIVSKDTAICKGDVATLLASSASGTVSWTGFGPVNTITVSPANTTAYIATSVDTNNCTNSKTVIVAVEDFNVTISGNTNPVLPGAMISLPTNGNSSHTAYKWEPTYLFSNQTASRQQFTTDSSLLVSAMAQSILGCKDTAYVNIIVTQLNDIYIPSGFTPNSDGKNDEVRVVGSGIKELDFKIFNRWGQLVFATVDKSKGWDGKLSGKLQPAATYVYFARVKLTSGQIRELKGTITLIR